METGHEHTLSSIFKIDPKYMLFDVINKVKSRQVNSTYLTVDFCRYIIETYNIDMNFIDDRFDMGNSIDTQNVSALHIIATFETNIEIYLLFIEKGANLNLQLPNKPSILAKVMKQSNQNIQLIKFLIEKGAKVNSQDLVQALSPAINGYYNKEECSKKIKIIELLLRKGGKVDKSVIKYLRQALTFQSGTIFVKRVFNLLRKMVRKHYISPEDINMIFKSLPRNYIQKHTEHEYDLAGIVYRELVVTRQPKNKMLGKIMEKIDIVEDYVMNYNQQKKTPDSFNSKDFMASRTV